MLRKTLRFVLPEQKFKILGSSRTDAMVSAQNAAFELFLYEPLEDLPEFLLLFNRNLPPDIRALEILETDAEFNIIQHPKMKEYLYLFSFGEKNHPFCAPLMANFPDQLDLELMKKGAKCYEGSHSWQNYCVRVSEQSKFQREIQKSQIEENSLITASFFPEKSYIFRIRAGGFLRQQVRMMMGALVSLGKGEVSLEQLKESLRPESHLQINYIAPASGLILNRIDFE